MAPEVIACDENPDATYDNRVSKTLLRGQILSVTVLAHQISGSMIVKLFSEFKRRSF